MSKWSLEDFKDMPLQRRKPCQLGHMLPNGTNPKWEKETEKGIIRYCVACKCRLPAGVFEFEFNNLTDPPPTSKQKYFTDEERRAARVKSQMAWNERNKDKFRSYVRKYETSGKRVEHRKQKYAALSPEEKEALLIAQRARNKENYEKKKQYWVENPEAYKAYLEKMKLKQRERYQRLREQNEHQGT